MGMTDLKSAETALGDEQPRRVEQLPGDIGYDGAKRAAGSEGARGNGEGADVAPDIAVLGADAFDVTYLHALTKLPPRPKFPPRPAPRG